MNRRIYKPIIIIICLLIGAMWIYALFFASKVSVNKIGDKTWKVNAESICASSIKERAALIDLRKVKDSGPNALVERAALIDKATKSLENAIDGLAALSVSDNKGKALIPLWISDYRIYISDRYAYTDELRNGINRPFAETVTEGIPISEKIATFAADNAVSSCIPPIDLSV
ncbi:MAG: hypothetical protein WCG49_00365 [Actinomycetes bacterium]